MIYCATYNIHEEWNIVEINLSSTMVNGKERKLLRVLVWMKILTRLLFISIMKRNKDEDQGSK